MNINEYYRFIKSDKPIKSQRYDCDISTGSYEPFELIAQKSQTGKPFFYLLEGKPDTFTANARREADFTISNDKNISGVYMPDRTVLKGYGDVRGTEDALLFQFSEDRTVIEIYVSRGQKHYQRELFDLFKKGELDKDIKLVKEPIIE